MKVLLVISLLIQNAAALVAVWAHFRKHLGAEAVAGWVLSVASVVALQPISRIEPHGLFVLVCLLAVGCIATSLGLTFKWSQADG